MKKIIFAGIIIVGILVLLLDQNQKQEAAAAALCQEFLTQLFTIENYDWPEDEDWQDYFSEEGWLAAKNNRMLTSYFSQAEELGVFLSPQTITLTKTAENADQSTNSYLYSVELMIVSNQESVKKEITISGGIATKRQNGVWKIHAPPAIKNISEYLEQANGL